MSGVVASIHQSKDFSVFLSGFGEKMRPAAAMGLNEHAEEQRRQSVIGISNYTGVPRGRVQSVTSVIKASPVGEMTATVRLEDKAVSLAEYGNPVWARDKKPAGFGGSVSSMSGAEATGWNVRRQFKHAFIANGQVVVRTTKSSYPLKVLSMAVLANELAKPTRPNVPAAERYAALDLENRVMRQVIRALGT